MTDPFDQPTRLPTSADPAADHSLAEPFDPRGQRAAALPELLDKVKINDDLADAAVEVWRKRARLHDPQFADILDAVTVADE